MVGAKPKVTSAVEPSLIRQLLAPKRIDGTSALRVWSTLTAELVAAVSNAGALGSIGPAYLTPEQIIERGRAVRAATSRPFGMVRQKKSWVDSGSGSLPSE